MSAHPPERRSLLDIVLDHCIDGDHNAVVFRIHDNDFAELAEDEQ